MNYPLTPLEQKAWTIAEFLHRGQIRNNSGLPYFTHVREVNGLAKIYNLNEKQRIAALLHDVVEDCLDQFDNSIEKALQYIFDEFGPDVANLVYELTTDKVVLNVLFKGDKTRYLTHKLTNISNEALEIKLCDREANLGDGFTSPKGVKYCESTKFIMNSLLLDRVLTSKQNKMINNILQKVENVLKIKK